MLESIEIRNYKSIEKINLPLGRVNVFIGENGAGKSNILEAIALAGAASARKLDNEFLTSRGIRVTQPQLMRPAFSGFSDSGSIKVAVRDDENSVIFYEIMNENTPYSQWQCSLTDESKRSASQFNDFLGKLQLFVNSDEGKSAESIEAMKALAKQLDDLIGKKNFEKKDSEVANDDNLEVSPVTLTLPAKNPLTDFFTKSLVTDSQISNYLKDFIIYSPENSSLRMFEREGQIEPLGINGEGLLKLLSVLSNDTDSETLEGIKSSLKLLGWFKDFEIVVESGASGRMEIEDQYLAEDKRYFDQKSSNEGFLFLTFYFALFSTDLTPRFFAIDNIDASLNPKLCQELMRQLVKLSIKHNKQVLLTTHNPAVLDGLNLDDDSQRLFVVSRGSRGQTRVRRIGKPKITEGNQPVRLSQMFVNGSLGGLPKGF